MKKYSCIVFLIAYSFSLIAQAPFVDIHSSDVKLLSMQEMRFCYISFVTVDGKKFLIKQKNKPNKILGSVRDAITAYVAESLNIAHKVAIIPAGMDFPGKFRADWPATIHTIAPGQMIKKLKSKTQFQHFNIKQADIGFRRDMLQWMAKYPELIKIIALDTFLCNHDRHRGNLFYDSKTKSFCAIDMDSSFKYNLCDLACKNFMQMIDINLFPLKPRELRALIEYRNILQFLIKTHKPEDTIEAFNGFIQEAGFVEGSPLYTERIGLELECNKATIQQSYQDAQMLINILNSIIKGVVKS